jgi:hypothetical protein
MRFAALSLVREEEKIYRYPIKRLAEVHENLTSYAFAYLYLVHDLFFWVREEKQVRQLRYDAFFIPLWDFMRIVGLETLCPITSEISQTKIFLLLCDMSPSHRSCTTLWLVFIPRS